MKESCLSTLHLLVALQRYFYGSLLAKDLNYMGFRLDMTHNIRFLVDALIASLKLGVGGTSTPNLKVQMDCRRMNSQRKIT